MAKIYKKDTVSSALKEQERAWYIIRNRLRDSKGKIVDTKYAIYKTPYFPDTDQSCETEPDTARTDTKIRIWIPHVWKLTAEILGCSTGSTAYV